MQALARTERQQVKLVIHSYSKDMLLKNVNTRILIFISTLLLVSNIEVKAQVTANVVVTPPYSPYVEDYINHTHITLSAIDFSSTNCFLNIKIVGDNGIEVYSKSDIIYPHFTLYNATPLVLSAIDLQDYFQIQNLLTVGISPTDLQNNGLPAGNYQLCVRVFDNGTPVSGDSPLGCSGYFSIPNLSVNVATQVVPPFMEDVTQYADRALVTLTANRPAKVRLNLRIEGDNGIVLRTSPTFSPANLISLSNVPQLITSGDLFDYFQANAWVVSGISSSDLFKSGLPEGTYKLCVSVYDNSGMVSPEGGVVGCSNMFSVRYLQPPMIVSPADQTVITNSTIQNIVFSWTPSPGAPVWTTYTLKIVEILDPSQNPNDDMLSATTPAFFETEVQGTAFLYGPAQPLLEPGRRYAFEVIAKDAESNRHFQNFGRSEVYSFTYGTSTTNIFNPNVSATSTDSINGSITVFSNDFSYVPETVIKGRLFCKFPDNPNGPISYINLINGSNSQIVIPNNYSTHTLQNKNDQKQGINYNDAMLLGINIGSSVNQNSITANYGVSSANNLGKYNFNPQTLTFFASTETMENTKPLPNTMVKLVGRVAYYKDGYPENGFMPDYHGPNAKQLIKSIVDMKGNDRGDADKIINVVLAVTETDQNGNFTFDFQSDFFTGHFTTVDITHPPISTEIQTLNPLEHLTWGMDEVFQGVNYMGGNVALGNAQNAGMGGGGQQHTMSLTIDDPSQYAGYICLKVEVVNEKFCSPDVDILAMPGDNVQLPDQVAKLKTYNLKVVPKASNVTGQVAPAGQPMDNVRVSIMRDSHKLNQELPLILNYEGERLTTHTVDDYGSFKNVAIDTTGSEGNIYVKNLVVQSDINPQYLIELSTRDNKISSTSYEDTKYNYQTIFEALPSSSQTSVDNNSSNNTYAVYNHLYTIPEVELDYTMQPLNPEIKGRIMAMTNSQNASEKDVSVELINQVDYFKTFSSMGEFENAYGGMKYYNNTSILKSEGSTTSNEIGFYQFKNLPINKIGDQVRGPYRRLFIRQPGYRDTVIPPLTMHAYNISLGQLLDIKDVNLTPVPPMRGYVVDEDGNAVASYVKTDYTPFYITEHQVWFGKDYEMFKIPVQSVHNTITVQPKSTQYYERDTSFSTLPTVPMKLMVFKKLHRPEIVVKDPKGNPVHFAKVEINNQTVYTNSQGVAQFKFASAGDQFTIKITSSSDYVPVQESISIPVSKTWTQFVYNLDYGISIHGVVTDKSNGQPIAGAEIYSELKSTNGTVLYIQCSSGQDGKYTLKGIPHGQTAFKFYAVKSGNNPSYVGDSKTINLTMLYNVLNPPSYNFALQRITGWNLTTIWNYPVVIEYFALVTGKTDEATVSGYIHNLPTTGDFVIEQSDLKIPFSGLHVKKLPNGKMEPVNDFIKLDVTDIPLVVNQSFSGDLIRLVGVAGNVQKYTRTQLRIEKSEDMAQLKGMVKLDISSINVASDFNAILYIGSSNLNNQLVAFSNQVTSSSSQYMNLSGQGLIATPNQVDVSVFKKHYNVFSLDNSLAPTPVKNYRVYGFNASSILGNSSYLMGDKIFLSTILHTDIATCQTCSSLDLNMSVGEVTISTSGISLNPSASAPLNFNLEKWKVTSQQGWHFDYNDEAIVIDKAFINTGVGIDATIKNLKVRPTSLSEGVIDMSNGGLSLGGVATIKLSSGLTPLFNYDNTGHYRISVVGNSASNQPAGYVDNLPEMQHGQRLEFASIGIMSDQTNVLTIMKTFRFYNLIDLEVSQIVSGKDYFDLQGTPDPKIPGFTPLMTAMRYKLDNGHIVGRMQPFQGVVDCPGNVEFELDTSQTFETGKYTAYGTFKVSPVNSGGAPFYLRGKLQRTNSSCKIDVIKVDALKKYEGDNAQDFKAGSNIVKITDGSIHTINNNSEWNSLVFNGNTSAIDGLNGAGADNTLTFTVYGDVDVSSSSIKLTNIDVGLGNMSLVFDFEKGSLYGNLVVHDVDLGYATVVYGQVSVKFDNSGYYLAMANTHLKLLQVLGVQGGLLIGNSSSVLPADVSALISGFEGKFKPNLSTIHGFYFIGQANLLDINEEVPVVPVLSINIKAGLGSYVMGDFDPANRKVKIGGYVFANASGGFSVGLCSFSVYTGASANMDGEYSFSPKVLTLQACADGDFGVHMCLYDVDVDFNFNLYAKHSSQTDVGYGFGFGKCSIK